MQIRELHFYSRTPYTLLLLSIAFIKRDVKWGLFSSKDSDKLLDHVKGCGTNYIVNVPISRIDLKWYSRKPRSLLSAGQVAKTVPTMPLQMICEHFFLGGGGNLNPIGIYIQTKNLLRLHIRTGCCWEGAEGGSWWILDPLLSMWLWFRWYKLRNISYSPNFMVKLTASSHSITHGTMDI